MLTLKQQRFIEEYLIDLNATQAAIRAGYSQKTAYSIGEENLRKPEISAAIEAGREELSKRAKITQDSIIDDLVALSREARAEKQYSPAIKAKELIGKHLGMFADNLNFRDVTPRAGFIERLRQKQAEKHANS